MMNAWLYDNINNLLKNSFLTEEEKNAIFYFFSEFLGSLHFSENYIIDYRNPSLSYDIQKIDDEKNHSIIISPHTYVTNNFFSIVIYKSNPFSPTFLYREVFHGILREDLIWLGNQDPKKIESRFYDAAAWNYMLYQIEKKKSPTSLQTMIEKIVDNNTVAEEYSKLTSFTPINLILDCYYGEILPDIEIITEEENSLLTLKVHQRIVTQLRCGNWYFSHLDFISQNEHIKQLKTSEDYPRILKKEF